MPPTDTTNIELSIAILLGTLFLVVASTAPMRFAIGALLLLAPFHLAEVLTITNSVAMVFMVAAGLMLKGVKLKVPMLGWILLVFLGYLVSISQVHPTLYKIHGVSLITLASGFVMFVLTYNLSRAVDSPRSIVDLLLVGNVLINLYSVVQLIVGPGLGASVLGLDALTIEANRGGGDPRLGGPFSGAPGILSQYLALMTIVGAFDVMHSDHGRRLRVVALLAMNVALLVATANRGGFVTLMIGFAVFLFVFRRELGVMRAIQIAIAGMFLLVASSLVIVKFTDFNIMYERLERVPVAESGIPDTRQQVWPAAWERFKEVPWFGQGPMWQLPEERHGQAYPGRVYLEYPHSLYLYLLVSVGLVGTATFAAFFLVLGIRLLQAARSVKGQTDYPAGLARLGPLLLFLFLLDQGRIEFLRAAYTDYQHVIFGLFGLWLGLAHRIHSAPISEQADANVVDPAPRFSKLSTATGGSVRRARSSR